MGIVSSAFSQTFPPASKFYPDDIPDLSGKVMIVTGGSSGIGRDTVKALLEHNAKVYIASYNTEKGEKAISDLKQQTGKTALFLKLDLADLQSVKAAAEEFNSKEQELHVLFNNAGLMFPPIDQLTKQGYDAQFGVHVLGHFYFTKLLLPALLAGAKSSPDKKARVVNTSSSGSLLVSGIDFNTLGDTAARKRFGTYSLYGQSKLGNIIFSNELARRYGDQGIVSTALNPGNIKSDLQRHLNFFEHLLLKPVLYEPSYGPLTQLWAGTSLEAAGLNGQYLVPWARVGKPGKPGQDAKLAQALWEWLEEQVDKNAPK